jgi:F420-dependent oxidoreductase-like protein
VNGLRIGLAIPNFGGSDGLEPLLARCRSAEQEGFRTVWIPQAFGHDALTLAAWAGRETHRIEIGTAVVPTFSRHPFFMAQQALSTQACTGGRLVLGLGPSHKALVEDVLGLSYAKPARHVREYLHVVRPLITTGKVEFRGEIYCVSGQLGVPGASPCPVLIAALAPLMRRVAGRLADGTITWMTGPRTLGDALIPEIRAAARDAGRPEPRIVAGFAVALTSEPAKARRFASKVFAAYGNLPSYRAMLDAEGVESPGELTIAGDEREIERALRNLASLGVTDLNAAILPFGSDPAAAARRTFALLGELARV